MKKKVVIALNAAWNLVNFRSGLIRALIDAGYDVVAVAPPDEYVVRLTELGCRYVPLQMDNKGTHPVRDTLLFWRFLKLLREERPACFLGYTVKPNIYGSLAAQSLGIPVVNNVAGLGTAFMTKGWLNWLVSGLYRFAFSRSSRVFFQNDHDLKLFVNRRLVRADRAARLPGSGVDLERFQVQSLQQREQTVFLLIARLLWDKGVGEYVGAARLIRRRHHAVRFQLLGFLGAQNRTAIPEATVREWVKEGVIEYLGSADDVRPYIAAADCVVLPSYREGAPRSLLEAAAMGRPIIATDVVGCGDVVADGVTGYLCRPYDVDSLVEQVDRFLSLSNESRRMMGLQGRRKMETEFDERLVIERYLSIVRQVVCADKSVANLAR